MMASDFDTRLHRGVLRSHSFATMRDSLHCWLAALLLTYTRKRPWTSIAREDFYLVLAGLHDTQYHPNQNFEARSWHRRKTS